MNIYMWLKRIKRKMTMSIWTKMYRLKIKSKKKRRYKQNQKKYVSARRNTTHIMFILKKIRLFVFKKGQYAVTRNGRIMNKKLNWKWRWKIFWRI